MLLSFGIYNFFVISNTYSEVTEEASKRLRRNSDFMKLNRIVFLSALTITAGISQAFAGTIDTGTLNYTFTGITTDVSCAGAHQRESFSGTVTDATSSLTNAPLVFSLCNIPGSYAGAQFTLTLDMSDVVSGTVIATDMSDVIASGIDTETVGGSFTVTSGTGVFAGGVGTSEYFSAVTAQNITTYAGSGTFTLTPTPEPATLALTGLGIVALGLAKRRRESGLID
jgi:hypothetical protein